MQAFRLVGGGIWHTAQLSEAWGSGGSERLPWEIQKGRAQRLSPVIACFGALLAHGSQAPPR